MSAGVSEALRKGFIYDVGANGILGSFFCLSKHTHTRFPASFQSIRIIPVLCPLSRTGGGSDPENGLVIALWLVQIVLLRHKLLFEQDVLQSV